MAISESEGQQGTPRHSFEDKPLRTATRGMRGEVFMASDRLNVGFCQNAGGTPINGEYRRSHENPNQSFIQTIIKIKTRLISL